MTIMVSRRIKFSLRATDGQPLPAGWVACINAYVLGSFLYVEFQEKVLMIPAHLLLEPVEYESK